MEDELIITVHVGKAEVVIPISSNGVPGKPLRIPLEKYLKEILDDNDPADWWKRGDQEPF